MLQNFQLRTKIMLGAPVMLCIVMALCILFTFIRVYGQQKDASHKRLDTAFNILRQEINDRTENLKDAGKQMIAANDMGAAIQFIAESWDESANLPFSLFRANYMEMIKSVHGIASTARIDHATLHSLNGDFMLGVIIDENGSLLCYSHDQDNIGQALLKPQESLASESWKNIESINDRFARKLNREPLDAETSGFCSQDGDLCLVARIPVSATVYDIETETLVPTIFGELTVYEKLDDEFASKVAGISGADVNVFAGSKLAAGTIPELFEYDIQSAPKTVQDWSFSGQETVHSESDIKGRGFFLAAAPIYFLGEKAGVITAVASKKEALANTLKVTGVLATVFIFCIIGSLPASYLLSKNMTNPIFEVASRLKDIAEGDGDLTARIPVRSGDEMGDLAKSFNTFIEKIQFLVRQIKDSSESVSSFIQNISTTAAQLSASSVETSTTISQISATAEQVKQTAVVANEKAEKTASEAEVMISVSEKGSKASNHAVQGMKMIRDEMIYLAESIAKLSENSQNVGEIMGVVNELANESNLLSVNASIEAAKAGEFGKGFSVVAQEVKTLSDQSRQATSQVRAILADIRNAVQTAVTAAERGAEAVDTGEELALLSGEAIASLSGTIDESSKSAAQIAASSQQQMHGMAQLSQAMESITAASRQNSESAKNLEDATAQLRDLGARLSELAGKFKA